MIKSFGLINYGLNNIESIKNVFNYLNIKIEIVNKFENKKYNGLILPGVGNFGRAMDIIRDRGLDKFIYQNINEQIPILGICLGMQLFFDYSEESGSPGLKIINGTINKIVTSASLPIPHMGWNQIRYTNKSKLFDKISEDTNYYFVHSYCVNCEKSMVTSEVSYGSNIISSVVHKNIYGVQFHPEKSSYSGIQIYKNFIDLC